MAKENLILVHSFPTNSILLSGFIDYLDQFFNVYFIDLPGFHKDKPPLPNPSLTSYSIYLQKQIEQLNLPSYILGGVSFGFLIVNQLNVSNECKAILAMEPFINAQNLNISSPKRIFYQTLIKIVQQLKVVDIIWRTSFLNSVLVWITKQTADRIRIVTEHIHPQTFLQTALQILSYQQTPQFHSLPYVLAINPHDQTVNVPQITQIFKDHCRKLFIIETQVDHYPQQMNKEYFNKTINRTDLLRMIKWVNSKP